MNIIRKTYLNLYYIGHCKSMSRYNGSRLRAEPNLYLLRCNLSQDCLPNDPLEFSLLRHPYNIKSFKVINIYGCVNMLTTCLMPRASCLVPHASCLMPRASATALYHVYLFGASYLNHATCPITASSCLMPNTCLMVHTCIMHR